MGKPVTAHHGRVLLDTCVVISLETIDLGRYRDNEAVVSAISIAELAYGLDVSDPVERLARTQRYNATLREFDVLPFETSAAEIYGAMAALMRRSGRSPRPRRLDLQIAATAAAHAMPLLTANEADFAGLDRLVHVVSMGDQHGSTRG